MCVCVCVGFGVYVCMCEGKCMDIPILVRYINVVVICHNEETFLYGIP